MSDNVKIVDYDDFRDCDGKKCGLGKHVASGNYICIHNNLQVKHPELINQWHSDNNPMNSYLSRSHQKVLWICELNPCKCHIWTAAIADRTSKNSGCPYCKSGKACEHNNLEMMFPQLKIEWNPNNPKKMNEYSYASCSIVSWICQHGKCECHIWDSSISNRTKEENPSGCPFCSKNTTRICKHNNLELLFPQLKIEWDSNNSKQMCEYSYGSGDIVSWICQNDKCQLRVWKMTINDRTSRNSGCPHCSKSKGYSDAEINWLISIEKKENIIIRNALSENGQFKIENVGKVDGYCESNNTVYEFHGDFWHGNPSIYNKDEINAVNKKLSVNFMIKL
jgi:glutaredoxin